MYKQNGETEQLFLIKLNKLILTIPNKFYNIGVFYKDLLTTSTKVAKTYRNNIQIENLIPKEKKEDIC